MNGVIFLKKICRISTKRAMRPWRIDEYGKEGHSDICLEFFIPAKDPLFSKQPYYLFETFADRDVLWA